jgi:metal-responsive CopG/Arc/MetJ family transcriptional regulator
VRKAVTVSLPGPLTEELDAVSREEGTTRSEVVRDALRRYFTLREYRALRAELTIEAESKGIVTDEDVFHRVS